MVILRDIPTTFICMQDIKGFTERNCANIKWGQ